MKKPIVLETPKGLPYVGIHLDRECIICHGKGKRGKYDKTSGYLKDGRCGRCEGIGFELTDQGRAVLDLIIRHKNTWIKTLEC